VAAGDEIFDWHDFYKAQFEGVVTEQAVEDFARQYKGSDEERAALLAAYDRFHGDMDAVYDVIMVSNPLDDEERFQEIIRKAVEAGEVPAHEKFTEESAKSKKARVDAAKKEAQKAEKEKKAMSKKNKGAGASEPSDLGSLAALIQRKNKERAASNWLDDLEAKYTKGGKKRKQELDEPPEEMFEATRKKMDKKKAAAKPSKGRKVAVVDDEDEDEDDAEPVASARKSKRSKK
jgi:DnaJ homolog subfamily C member 9